ncbi:iron-siderophore ABC transporter substrate-binding protein [Conexibacter woesei]|uniref:iron-siderophore ABC transporter substrate-binding protein n=1 Tax=Conexibacter woesei TaxID=191495 RepID=UPI000418CB28|nr:iron-siderophore ABC transporter substrate-binding protein [Conexibacter woesei]
MASRSTRRQLLISAAGAAALTAVGCGSSNDDKNSGTTAGAAGAAGGQYPLKVTDAFGTVAIDSAPKRIVTYGYTDADPMLALGAVPVGLLQWIPQWKRGVGVWAEPALKGATPELYAGSEIDFEGVAKSRPDLILAVTYSFRKSDYEKLSKIAPVVTTPAGYPDWGTPWQVATKQLGAALGRPEQAKQLVADAEAEFTRAKSDHPHFAGKDVLIVAPDTNGKMAVFAPTDTRGRFATSLGFSQPAAIEKLTGRSFYADISEERYDLLDVDALLVMTDDAKAGAALERSPQFQALKVVKEGRAIVTNDLELNMAISSSTVLSIPYALDRVVPQLDAALTKV